MYSGQPGDSPLARQSQDTQPSFPPLWSPPPPPPPGGGGPQRPHRGLAVGIIGGALAFVVVLTIVLVAVLHGAAMPSTAQDGGDQTSGASATSTALAAAATAGANATATASAAVSPTATKAPTATATSPAAPTVTPAPAHLQSTIITRSLSAGANTNSSIVDMACPSGYLVAGGGPNSGYSGVTLMQNHPLTSTTWRAEIFNHGGSAVSVQLQVVCLMYPGLHSQIKIIALNNVAPGANSSILDQTCDPGYFVAGGGPNSGYATFTQMSDGPVSATAWEGEVYNTGGSTISVQLNFVCLAAIGLDAQIESIGLGAVAAHTNSSIHDQVCPSGYLAAGGGMRTGYTTVYEMWDAPLNTTTWRGEVFNSGAGAVYGEIDFICMKA